MMKSAAGHSKTGYQAPGSLSGSSCQWFQLSFVQWQITKTPFFAGCISVT